MNHAFITNPEGEHLLQATNIDNAGFFRNKLMLVDENTVEIH